MPKYPLLGAITITTLAFAFPAYAQPDENELTGAPEPLPPAAIPLSGDKEPAPSTAEPLGVAGTISNSLIFRGTKESTLLTVLIGAYDINKWVSVFGRLGTVHNASQDAPSATGVGNPIVGMTFNLPGTDHIKLGGITGVSIPIGSGGGNAPSAGMLRAWCNSTDWGGVMFAVNQLDVQAGLNSTFLAGPLSLRVESTLHELSRVRGEKADIYGANSTVTSSTATVSYSIMSKVSVSSAISETRFWNTPKAIQDSPTSRVDYYYIGGISTDLRVAGVGVTPAISYARALDLPLSADKFQVVELDLGFSL